MVFAITCRRSLKEKVIPFLEKYMIFSSKKEEIRRFKEIIDALESKEHLRPEGMIRIVEKAYAMNSAGKGKKRSRSLKEIVERILRDHTPDTPKK